MSDKLKIEFMNKEATKGELILYKTPDGNIALDVHLEQETLWLTLNQLAKLFERDKSVISRHLRNIYKDKELVKKATVAKNATVQMESGRKVIRQVNFYNLDAIISVGYRVNSKRGTEFRIWATNILKQHIIQGYSVKDLYPSIEEKAAHLLYFIVKNHSFVDGNKRIAAAIFLRFAEKNKLIYDSTGNRRIADNALVAMTLMVAESRPKEKEIITAMLTNLINSENKP